MKKTYSYIAILIVIVGGATAYFFTKEKESEPKTYPISSSTSSHDMGGMDHSTMTTPATSTDTIIDLTSEATVQIDIKDFAYTKKNVKIKKGTTVTWTNLDSIKHNVMAEHDDSEIAHDAPTVSSAESLNGPLLNQGESYTFTFNSVDTVPYHCSPHPDMKGSVYVVDAQ